MTDLEPIPDSALKRLGGELAQLLDDDQWNNTEKRYLLPALEEQDALRAEVEEQTRRADNNFRGMKELRAEVETEKAKAVANFRKYEVHEHALEVAHEQNASLRAEVEAANKQFAEAEKQWEADWHDAGDYSLLQSYLDGEPVTTEFGGKLTKRVMDRESALQARIAELEAALGECIELADAGMFDSALDRIAKALRGEVG